MIHHISAEYLTVDRVREILENNIKIDLSEDAKKRIVRCREYLDNKMETQKEPIYGITTGFGSLCNISIDKDQLSQLQKNLVMSHACGTGERVPAEIVKLMLLLKIQSLSYGNSGVQLETVQRLVDFFNNDVLPVVFQQGSLGASGDLAPLANMCLPLLGLGEVEYKGGTASFGRSSQGIRLEAYFAAIEGGPRPAERYAVHVGFRRIFAYQGSSLERVGRPDRRDVARRIRRTHQPVHRRGA